MARWAAWGDVSTSRHFDVLEIIIHIASSCMSWAGFRCRGWRGDLWFANGGGPWTGEECLRQVDRVERLRGEECLSSNEGERGESRGVEEFRASQDVLRFAPCMDSSFLPLTFMFAASLNFTLASSGLGSVAVLTMPYFLNLVCLLLPRSPRRKPDLLCHQKHDIWSRRYLTCSQRGSGRVFVCRLK
jgi:hypothetical protein